MNESLQRQLIPAVRVRIDRGEVRRSQARFTGSFSLGRGDECEIQFADPVISTVHATVQWDNGKWWVQDMGSKNGTFLDGAPIGRTLLPVQAFLELAHNGPAIMLEIEPTPSLVSLPEPEERKDLEQVVEHYFGGSNLTQMGERTRLIRQAYQTVHHKQRKQYRWVIAVIAVLLVITAGALFYQSRRVAQLERLHALAADIFYSMKLLELQVESLQTSVARSGDPKLKKDFEDKVRQQRALQENYNNFARDELGISRDRLSEEDWLIYKVARLFGECDVRMPPAFVQTVKDYIHRWQSTPRLQVALERANLNGYPAKIAKTMIANDMPPQFFYLALQESDFDIHKVGPWTRKGLAKGMWQFIPETAWKYGMHTGPLADIRQYDPLDDRQNAERSTQAAAMYLHDLYRTEAQGSGLLVMACYNWGEDRVLDLIGKMPENPRDRNFWNLLSRAKVPDQTYDYVFYIFSAAVIGENPRLFGFSFDDPLQLDYRKFTRPDSLMVSG